MRVIGIGNEERGDDGAGVAVARLAEGEVHCGELAGLLDRWDADDDVVVVDAMRTGRPPGTIRWFEVRPDEVVPTLGATTSSHTLDLPATLELGRVLGRLPRRLRVIGVEAGDVAVGAGLSPEVRTAVHELAAVLHPAGRPEAALPV